MNARSLRDKVRSMDDWQNVSSDLDARNRIVTSYLPLVRYVAAQMRARLPTHIDIEDLIAYGNIGLIGAVERYDPHRGVKFTTFAVQRIRGAILDELRTQDWAPRRVRRNGRLVMQALDVLNERLQRDPTSPELADELCMAEPDVHRILAELQRANHLALDMQWDLDGLRFDDPRGHSLIDDIRDKGATHVAPDDDVVEGEHARRIASSLEMLREHERIVMALYYFEDQTFLQIAELLGVTESRVFQVHSSAMTSLRSLSMV